MCGGGEDDADKKDKYKDYSEQELQSIDEDAKKSGMRRDDIIQAREHKKNFNHKLDKDGSKPAVNMDDRRCTDLLFCPVFIAMIIVMVAIAGFAFGQGDVNKIATKYDMDGNKCEGDFKFKLFTRLIDRSVKVAGTDVEIPIGTNIGYDYKDWSVCIEKCPQKDDVDLKYKTNTEYPDGSDELLWWDRDTVQLMGFCVPDLRDASDLQKVLYEQLNEQLGSFGKYMTDLVEGWKIILVMSFGSLFITLLYLCLLKWITKPILFTSLFLILILGALVTAWCYLEMNKFPEESDDRKYAMAGAITSGVLTALYVCFLCCQCTNIKIGAEIMGAAGNFVSSNSRIVLIPIMSYIVCLPILAGYIVVNVFLYSTGEPKFVDGAMFAHIENGKNTEAMFWIFLFGFFWVIALVMAIQQFTIAAATAQWYFEQGPDSDSRGMVSISKGLCWSFRYHMSSLAFGSMLIAIVTFLKVFFEYLAKKGDAVNGNNPVWQCVKWCIRCIIWCLDKCVKFITENAYIQIAINGTDFCESAKNGFFMMLRNAGNYTAMVVVGWIMTAIGKGVIVGLSTYITILLAQKNILVATEGATINMPYIPAFPVLLISWLVAGLFITIFDFSALTILQCFLTCKEVSDSKGIYVDSPACLQGYLKITKQDVIDKKESPEKKYEIKENPVE